MHLTYRNVNDAFRGLVDAFHNGDGYIPTTNDRFPVVERPSRNGPVLMIDEPVTITYTHPKERVLFNAVRDANPFFHVYESLWMLAGRNDVAPLVYYVKDFIKFSDDGRTLNGAYGYRWRKHEVKGEVFQGDQWNETYDQLDLLVAHLKADPNSRRAVLQMWNVEDDLLKIGGGKCAMCDGAGEIQTGGPPSPSWMICPKCRNIKDKGSKDVCCNLSVMFSLREMDRGEKLYGGPLPRMLDMTVTNRSNDLLWGLLGANYVHFTVLQEYMAARLGVEVGKYHHISNNLHVYKDRKDWRPEELLEADRWSPSYGLGTASDPAPSASGKPLWDTVPLVRDPEAFELELPLFVEHYKSDNLGNDSPFRTWEEPFLETVAAPMLNAFCGHKRRTATTMSWVQRIAADDWRVAAKAWIERRVK
jgi:thymidylate synthase